MAGVDRVVADRLALEVVGDRPHLQPVALEDRVPAGHVVVVLGRPPHVEVIAPAGDLQPVVAPLAGEPGHLGEGQVGPLAGEQGDGAGHGHLLYEQNGRRKARPSTASASCVGASGRQIEAAVAMVALSPVKDSMQIGTVVAGGVEGGEDPRPVEVVVAGRAPLAAGRPGRGRCARRPARSPPATSDLLDVHVVHVEHQAAALDRQRVDRLQRLLDRVEHAGLVAVERLDADAHAALGRHTSHDRSQVRRQLGVGRRPLGGVHPPASGRPRRTRGRRSPSPRRQRRRRRPDAGSPGSWPPSQHPSPPAHGRHPSRATTVAPSPSRPSRSAAPVRVPVAGVLDRELDHVEPPVADPGRQRGQPLVGER